MCDTVSEVNVVRRIERKKYMEFLVKHKDYGVFYDPLNFLWYLCRLDKSDNPLEVFDGSKEVIYSIFNEFVKTDAIDYEVLNSDESI